VQAITVISNLILLLPKIESIVRGSETINCKSFQDHFHREEEAVAELQDGLLESELGPDQLQVILGHEPLGRAQVLRGFQLEEVAVRVLGLAVVEPGGVEGDHEDGFRS
jgi:hypothetical protein